MKKVIEQQDKYVKINFQNAQDGTSLIQLSNDGTNWVIIEKSKAREVALAIYPELESELEKQKELYKGLKEFGDERISKLESELAEKDKEIQRYRVRISDFADWLNENFETTINCAWLGKKGIYRGGVYASSQLRSIYFESLNQ